MNTGNSLADRSIRAFTLVELLVSMSIITLLMLILVQMVNSTSALWSRTTAKVEQFRAAREAFESMTRNISQATLNTYWDYDNAQAPTTFIRQSELRFISGPMTNSSSPNHLISSLPSPPRYWPSMGIFLFAPLGAADPPTNNTANSPTNYNGLPNLLNTVGYFVEFNTDRDYIPKFLVGTVQERYRFRLMEMRVPSDQVTIYQSTSGLNGSTYKNITYTGRDWFQGPTSGGQNSFLTNASAASGGYPMTRILADNIVQLIILPRLSSQDEAALATTTSSPPPPPALCQDYFYDTALNQINPQIPSGEQQRYASGLTNPVNQLPPVVTVAMVAIDEKSAQFWASKNNQTMPDLDSSAGLFSGIVGSGHDSTNLFNSSNSGTTGQGDLYLFEQFLTQQKLTYRVFSANIALGGAKWSTQQTNQSGGS
jgi:uncharacterized protein (TIGR02599 family)